MPTNLPPEYFDAEERYKSADTPEERVAGLEEMLAVVPKHKGTDKLRADLRKRLSKLKENIEAAKKSGGGRKSVYNVEREGPVQIVLLGPPNGGKSALLASLTHAAPKVSEYPFTTWAPVPGMMSVRDIQLQLVDTPALSEEHVEPEMFNLVRNADFILLILDLQGRALDQFDHAIALLDTRRVTLRGPEPPEHVRPGQAVAPCLVLANKCDDEAWDEEFAVLKELAGNKLPFMPVSAATGRNLDALREELFDRLGLMRVYTKQPHQDPDMGTPFVLKRGDTVLELAGHVHKDFVNELKTARVWGAGVHDGQQVGRDHVLEDGDIVELHI